MKQCSLIAIAVLLCCFSCNKKSDTIAQPVTGNYLIIGYNGGFVSTGYSFNHLFKILHKQKTSMVMKTNAYLAGQNLHH